MKRILSLSAALACLFSLSVAQSLPPSPCSTPSFKGARSLNLGAGSNGGEATSAAFADLNNDGLPDLVASNAQSSAVSVMLGTGQGFADPVNYSVGGSRPFAVAVGDFNRDGKPDVVTANAQSSNVSVMLGDGAGAFLPPTLLSASADPIDVIVADFNGDGKQDLAVACSTAEVLKVALGDGAGGFGAFSTYTVGSRPRSVVAADFNLDGRVDLALPNTFSNNVSVLLGDGAGGFGAQTLFDVGANPQDLAAADFNGDGRADLAIANGGSPGVSVMFGTGDGKFGAPQNFSVGGGVGSVITGDFNNDGSADIAAGTNVSNLSILLGDGAGGFGIPKNFPIAFGQLFAASGDYNLDGNEDIAVAAYQQGAIIPLAGDGQGNFATTPRLTTASNGAAISLADFNGDGKLDVTYANDNADTVSVRLGDGAGSFGNAATFAAGSRPIGVNVADFNNDGKPDIVAASTNLTSIAVLLGDGQGFFAAPVITSSLPPVKPSVIAVGDVNKDNKADVILARVDNNFQVTVLLGNGAGGFAAPANYATAPLPRTIAVGDYNSDGKPDLAVSDNHFSILLGDGAGGFGAPINTNFGDNTGSTAIVSADFNGDGKLDLALANEFTNNVSVLLGNGAAQFAPRVNFKVGGSPSSLAAADFNGDGRVDLVAGNRSSVSVSVILGDGAGGFGQPFNWLAPVTSLAVGDLDNDGRVDIVANGFNALSPLVNTCGQDAAVLPSARLSVNDVSVNEPDSGTANAVFTVSLAAPSASPVTVKYVTRAGNAERVRDFQPIAGMLTFAPGVTTQTVPVAVNGDTLDEFDEVFTLNLYDPSGALIADRQGFATVNDNDAPPSVSVGNASAFEGQANNNVAVPVTLSQPSGKLVSVNYSTADGTATAGADYVGGSGTVSIPAGANANVINVQVVGDSVNEPDETFAVNLSSPVNATVAAAQGVVTLVNDDASSVQLASIQFPVNEGASVDVVVNRAGDTTREAFVNYSTADGTANSRRDYTTAVGTLRFAPGETQKTFRVLTTDDRYNDDDESFTVALSAPVGAGLGAQTSATVNIIDNDTADGPSPVGNVAFDPDFFVRQHYADFLNREPDADGLAFWKNEITQCGSDEQCKEVKRINVSAAFFLSIEFQETGYLVERVYKTAYGDATSPNVPGTVPVVRFNEFLPDTQRIGRGVVVNVGNWQAQLEANKEAYALEFVQRPRFLAAFPLTLTPAQFVDKLVQNAGLTLTTDERDALISTLGATPADASKRAQVLRAVAENQRLRDNEFRRAFVLMQYFGYLRRNPDDPQDTDFRGWKFWLDKLNQFNGNYVQAEMVKAFLDSTEYRLRFGQ